MYDGALNQLVERDAPAVSRYVASSLTMILGREVSVCYDKDYIISIVII